jgi:transposase InsO family protein
MSKSRAAYYKQMKRQEQQKLQDHIIHELVMEKRKKMPRLGGKKLYRLVHTSMEEHLISMGRDKFFSWLKAHDLLVRPKKRFTKTTHSLHRFRVHKNLIKDIEITRPDQLWVSDITYLKLQKGFCYLALITDVYSRKIIGYDISQSLELTGCLRALRMACEQRKIPHTVHHSDRGIQYCSKPYIDHLKENQIQISMAEAGNCYENAIAERVNGILKDEFNLDRLFNDLKDAQKATWQAIETYNTERPHMAIGMKMPCELYAA